MAAHTKPSTSITESGVVHIYIILFCCSIYNLCIAIMNYWTIMLYYFHTEWLPCLVFVHHHLLLFPTERLCCNQQCDGMHYTDHTTVFIANFGIKHCSLYNYRQNLILKQENSGKEENMHRELLVLSLHPLLPGHRYWLSSLWSVSCF